MTTIATILSNNFWQIFFCVSVGRNELLHKEESSSNNTERYTAPAVAREQCKAQKKSDWDEWAGTNAYSIFHLVVQLCWVCRVVLFSVAREQRKAQKKVNWDECGKWVYIVLLEHILVYLALVHYDVTYTDGWDVKYCVGVGHALYSTYCGKK